MRRDSRKPLQRDDKIAVAEYVQFSIYVPKVWDGNGHFFMDILVHKRVINTSAIPNQNPT